MSMESFDSLKREATKLERQLEDKVSRYQQLVQSLPDTTNDLLMAESGMHSTEDEATLRHDIQRTLTNMQDLITTKLQPSAEQSRSQNSSLLVKRYREILFDLTGDFEKSRQAHVRKQERAKLMEGARTNSQNDNVDPAMDHLMREGRHIGNSLNAAASVINQATEVRSDLRTQGLSLGRVQNTMGVIASNIPGLNTLVEQIRRKRSKDDKILAGVIASCILFTLWYLFG